MQIALTKINPNEYKLSLTRVDKTTDQAILDYRSFLKHDLVHFVFENNAGEMNGFYGLLAKGKSLKDLSPQNMKENETELSQLMVVESIVGPLQGSLTSGAIDFEQLLSYLKLNKLAIPSYLNKSLLDSVLREVQVLFNRFERMNIGDSIELEFFENQSGNACLPPKSVGSISSNIKKLGKK